MRSSNSSFPWKCLLAYWRQGGQIFSDYTARIVAEPSPEDAPDGGRKHSRIFLCDPAQSTFDWSRETSEGEMEGPHVG
jgi:hypothetical protein